jgi:hypothetical protein
VNGDDADNLNVKISSNSEGWELDELADMLVPRKNDFHLHLDSNYLINVKNSKKICFSYHIDISADQLLYIT